MDIQREEFEVWAKKETSWDLYWSDNISQYMDHQTNAGWLAWQESKKQAIPEGFILVPTVPSERMVLAVRQCYEGEHYLPYSLYSEFINQAIIERMEAQEQTHD